MIPRVRSAALVPLDAVQRHVGDVVRRVARRRVPLDAAQGAVCAEDIRAAGDHPAGIAALRDGWAVSSAAVLGASPYAPIRLLQPPTWVESGDNLPPGTDTVLAPEAIEAGEIVVDAPAGDGARAVGAELAAGELLAMSGTRLTEMRILALAAAGAGDVAIRRPRVRLVATGSAGEARAVCRALAATIERTGAAVAGIVGAGDAIEAIAEAIAADGVDAVFVVGGTGFGRTDLSGAALARAGSVLAHGMALKPCESAGFGTAQARPVVLVPGRPEAALAAFLALGRPLLAALSGVVLPPPRPARLLRKVASTIGLSEIVFVRRIGDAVEPLGGADLPLRRLVLADGAILVPPEREGYPEDALVEIIEW